MGFTINIAKGKPKVNHEDKPVRVSRLCLGVCVKEDGMFKIHIKTSREHNADILSIPFTEESFNLKGRTTVFSVKKDRRKRYIRYLRDKMRSIIFPGFPKQYCTVSEKEVCSGYIVRVKGKLYFELNDVHGKGENLIDLPSRLNERKPLFLSSYEHNTDK